MRVSVCLRASALSLAIFTALVTAQAAAAADGAGCAAPTADWPGVTPTLPVTWKTLPGGQVSDKTSYRRLLLTFDPCKTFPRSYEQEHRVWWKRYFDPKTNEKILLMTTKVSKFDTETNQTLMKISKASTRKSGEGWDTEVVGGQTLTPYFRVDRDTNASFKLEFKGSTKHGISISSDLLKVTERAAELIAPASAPLLTSENSVKFNEAAQFVDSAINSFFELNIREATSRDTSISVSGDDDQPLAIIPVVIPPATTTIAEGPVKTAQVGIWTVMLSRPLYSFFAPVTDSGQAPSAATLSSASILNFRVNSDKSLGEHLAGQEEVVRLRDALVDQDKKNFEVEAASLCAAVNNRADAVGLTIIDSAAASWAYLRTLPLSAADRGKADKSCGKVVHQYPV